MLDSGSGSGLDSTSNSSVLNDFSNTIFWFLDKNSCFSEVYSDKLLKTIEIESTLHGDDDGDEEVRQGLAKTDESKAFWDGQYQLLKAILCRTTPIESRVRQAIKEALGVAKPSCGCRRGATSGGCRSCLRRDIFSRLSVAGYNCSICKSKWSSTSTIPSGEHTFLEVVEREEGGEPMRVIVELHFKSEFEMARASDEYNRLVSRLPEVFVGKPERLRSLIKILCGASKRCMKESKMHMAPWRRHNYMEAKWLSNSATCQLTTTSVVAPPTVGGLSGARLRKSSASMLTFAVLENLPRPKCQVVRRSCLIDGL